MSTVSPGSDPFSLLVGKALVDKKFRAKVLNPSRQVEALKEIGVAAPTAEQIRQLNACITALEQLEGEFSTKTGTA